MSSETTPAHAPSGVPCDVAGLVEIIAEKVQAGDSTADARRALNDTLEALIAARIAYALSELKRSHN